MRAPQAAALPFLSALPLSAALACLALPAASEGARQVYDCAATTFCDGDGACAPSDRAVRFELQPQETGPLGEGGYAIAYDGVTAVAQNRTGLGPIDWSEGASDLQTLLFAGETALVWHRLSFAAPARSETFFLTCEVTR